MPNPVVFRSTSDRVLATHHRNIARAATAERKRRTFTEQTGLEPVIVVHPEGAVATGVRPLHSADPAPPPAGWYLDGERGMLAPSLGPDGQAALAALAELDWTAEPLPGLDGGLVRPHLPLDHPHSTIAEIAPLPVGTAVEVDGAVWVALPRLAASDVDTSLWAPTRRYLLERARSASRALIAHL